MKAYPYLTDGDKVDFDALESKSDQYFNMMEKGFVSSERAIAAGERWNLIIGLTAVVGIFGFLASFEIISGLFGEHGLNIIQGNSSTREWLELLLFIIGFAAIIVLHNLINRAVQRYCEKSIQDKDKREFFYVQMTLKSIEAFRSTGKKRHVKVAEKYFSKYSDEALTIYSEDDSKSSIQLHDINNYHNKSHWMVLTDSSHRLLSSLAALQNLFGSFMKDEKTISNLSYIIKHLGLYCFVVVDIKENPKVCHSVSKKLLKRINNPSWESSLELLFEATSRAKQTRFKWVNNLTQRVTKLYKNHLTMRIAAWTIGPAFLFVLLAYIGGLLFGDNELLNTGWIGGAGIGLSYALSSIYNKRNI